MISIFKYGVKHPIKQSFLFGIHHGKSQSVFPNNGIFISLISQLFDLLISQLFDLLF